MFFLKDLHRVHTRIHTAPLIPNGANAKTSNHQLRPQIVFFGA
jgi:hypothetical protein